MTEISDTTNETTQITRARNALDRLDKAFRKITDQKEEKPSPRIFEIEVLGTLVEAKTYIGTIEDSEREGLFSLQDRLAQKRKDLISYIARRLEDKIEIIKRTGEPEDWEDWLGQLRRLDENQAPSYQIARRKAQQLWVNQTFFDRATQAYKDLKSEIDRGRYDSETKQYLAMEGVLADLTDARDSLERYIAQICSEDIREFGEKKTTLESMIAQLEQDIAPYRKAHADLPTILLDQAYGEQLAVIEQAEVEGRRVTYYQKGSENNFDEKTGRFENDVTVEQSAKRAKEVLYSRWNKFSAFKYNSYFKFVDDRLNTDDPIELEKYFQEKTLGTLRPINEINDPDLRANYNATKRKIQVVFRQKKELEEQIRLIITQEDPYESWRQLIHLRDDGTKRTRFLNNIIRDALDERKAEITKDLVTEFNYLRNVFKIDPKQARQLGQKVQNKISGIKEDDFEDIHSQKTTIEMFLQLCDTVTEVLDQVRHEKPPEARRRIEKAIDEVERRGYAIPEPLSDARNFIRTSLNPLEQAQEILREIDEVYEKDDIDIARELKMEDVILLKARVNTACLELDNIHKEGKTIALEEFQETLVQLNAAKKRLNRLINYRNANNEIQRSDADLRAIKEWLPNFENHPVYKAEASRIEVEIQRLQRNDDDLKQLLDLVDTLIDQQAGIGELLSIFHKLENYDEKPTTLRQELVHRKRLLRVNLYDSISISLSDFDESPNPAHIEETESQLEWLKKEFPDYEELGNFEGAACEAEAIKAEGESNWSYAWIKWQEAASHRRKDARERAEACLKLWAIEEAIQKKYGVLRDRALTSPVLREDELINRLQIQHLLEVKKQEYQDPEILLRKTEASTDLNKIKSHMDASNDEGMDESDKFEYLKIWNKYNYPDYIGEKTLASLPTLTDLREILKFYKEVFSRLVLVSKKVRPENRLMELYQGVQSANRYIEDLEGDPIFTETWDRLVDYVVLKLDQEIGKRGGM